MKKAKDENQSDMPNIKLKPATEARKETIDEYHRIEINEILTRMRGQASLRAQFYSFLGTAHFLVLGLALSNQKISLLIIAMIPLVALLVIDPGFRRSEAAVELRGIELENKYAPDPEKALLHSLIAVSHTSSYWVKKLDGINTIEGFSERIKALRKTKLGLAGSVAIPLLILIEIGIAVNFYFAGWKLF